MVSVFFLSLSPLDFGFEAIRVRDTDGHRSTQIEVDVGPCPLQSSRSSTIDDVKRDPMSHGDGFAIERCEREPAKIFLEAMCLISEDADGDGFAQP